MRKLAAYARRSTTGSARDAPHTRSWFGQLSIIVQRSNGMQGLQSRYPNHW